MSDVCFGLYDGLDVKCELGMIGFLVCCSGDVIGDYEVMLVLDMEILLFCYMVLDCVVFVYGVIKVVEWVVC